MIGQLVSSETKNYWYEGKHHEELCRRRKGWHLEAWHKSYIWKLLKDYPENSHNIRNAFKLSKSTFFKLKKFENSAFDEEETIFQQSRENPQISVNAQRFISETLRPPQFSMTIQKIRKAIFNEFGETYSTYIVKSFIKKTLRFSFKKGWSRPPKYIQPKTIITKGVFWTDMLRMINKQQLIFNVDEWSFTRALKTEYSWLPVGESSMIINDNWKGSASLIMAIGSNSQWFGIIIQKTVNSEVFWIFLNLLKRVLKDTRDKKYKLSLIILDNARIHCSSYTKKIIKYLKFEVKALPPYCPEVTPVEHIFRAIKSKLRSLNSMQTIDFGEQSGVSKIRDCAVDISKYIHKSAWTEVIKEWSNEIKSTMSEITKKNQKQ